MPRAVRIAAHQRLKPLLWTPLSGQPRMASTGLAPAFRDQGASAPPLHTEPAGRSGPGGIERPASRPFHLRAGRNRFACSDRQSPSTTAPASGLSCRLRCNRERREVLGGHCASLRSRTYATKVISMSHVQWWRAMGLVVPAWSLPIVPATSRVAQAARQAPGPPRPTEAPQRRRTSGPPGGFNAVPDPPRTKARLRPVTPACVVHASRLWEQSGVLVILLIGTRQRLAPGA